MHHTILQPDTEQWNRFVSSHPRAHFLQTTPWADVKADFGWTSKRFALKNQDGQWVAGAQVLFRRLPSGMLGTLAYVPFGPVVDWNDNALVRDTFLKLEKVAKRNGAAFIKIEPGFDVPVEVLKSLKFQSSPQTIQPPRTIILDIRRRDTEGNPIGEDVIQSRMNQMTRRNIRKSAKQDVQIREASREDVARFNDILQTTANRNDFGVHVPAYYQKVYDCFAGRDHDPRAVLLMASYADEETGQNHDLAGVYVFLCGKHAWYVYGASSNKERKRMASFGAQWAGIQWARKHGAVTYDMVGVPDEEPFFLEEHFTERNDGMWGVYRFKRGWGGDVKRTVGAWDRVYNPMVYWAYRSYLFVRNRDDDDV